MTRPHGQRLTIRSSGKQDSVTPAGGTLFLSAHGLSMALAMLSTRLWQAQARLAPRRPARSLSIEHHGKYCKSCAY
ncbi:MAG: hypothetical protein JKX98_08095 [Alcanivoracaceae bacterium]|nr:hypothetical protein [Alcanivoracaceae bacterium]